MLVAMDLIEEAIMSLKATRALQSTDPRAIAVRPEHYMVAARQLRSETITAGAATVLARTAEAIRNLVALHPAPLRRSRPV